MDLRVSEVSKEELQLEGGVVVLLFCQTDFCAEMLLGVVLLCSCFAKQVVVSKF